MIKLENFKVGLTVLIGLMAFAVILTIVGQEDFLFDRTYRLKIFVENVEGLAKGSMVSLGGLKIGKVEELQFGTKNGKNGVDVIFRVQKNRMDRITTNSSATVKTVGLLGDKFIDISIGQVGEPSLAEYSYIELKPGFDMNMVYNDLKSNLKTFSETSVSIKNLADAIRGGDGTIGKLMKDPSFYNNLCSVTNEAGKVFSAINSDKGLIGKALHDETLYNDAKEVAKNLKDLTSSISSGKGALGKLIKEDSLYTNLNTISSRINKVLSKAEDKNNMVGSLFNDDQMYIQINTLLKELKALVEDINKNPKKYVNLSIF